MEKARVIVIGDDAEFLRVTSANLVASGHAVLGQAESFVQTKELVDSLEPHNIDVAVVSSELRGNFGGDQDSNKAVHYIRQKLGETTIIGAHHGAEVPNADHQVLQGDVWTLDDIVRGLPNRGRPLHEHIAETILGPYYWLKSKLPK